MKWKVHWLKKPILCAMYLISLKLGNSSEESIDHWSFLHVVVWFFESYDYRPNWIHSVLIFPSLSYGAYTLHVLCLKLWGDWSWKVAYLSLNDISSKNQWEKCFVRVLIKQFYVFTRVQVKHQPLGFQFSPTSLATSPVKKQVKLQNILPKIMLQKPQKLVMEFPSSRNPSWRW